MPPRRYLKLFAIKPVVSRSPFRLIVRIRTAEDAEDVRHDSENVLPPPPLPAWSPGVLEREESFIDERESPDVRGKL